MSYLFRVINFPAVLDSIMVTKLQHEIQAVVEAGVKVVLLDLKDVEFINSSSLMALVVALRIVRTGGGKVFICSINEQVKILLELTGIDQLFETFANLDEFNNAVLMKT
jgi:anti-anti-sigma factor